jgi:hypothetical protein
MDEPEAAAPLTFKQRFLLPKNLALLAAGLAVGAVGAALGWQAWLKPQRELAEKRFNTLKDVTTLFGLQLQYKAANGVYANDLDSLLTLAPDRGAFKTRMAEHLDVATLAVVGTADKFKIEANVLDKERTLVKLKGPIATPPPREAPKLNPEASSAAGPDAGAPVAAPPAN